MAAWRVFQRSRVLPLPCIGQRRLTSNTSVGGTLARLVGRTWRHSGAPPECAPNGIYTRFSSSSTAAEEEELDGCGVVIGCYETEEGEGWELSGAGRSLDQKAGGMLSQMIKSSGGKVKKGESRLFYGLSEELGHVAVVGAGPQSPSDDHMEDIDVGRENVRTAAATGVKILQKARVRDILLDDFTDAEACAEGTVLSLFSFDKLKAEKKRKKIPQVRLISEDIDTCKAWDKGWVIGKAQNFARELMETPSNLMTPSLFVEEVSRHLGQLSSVTPSGGQLEINPRPLSWIKSQGMGAFLSVAQGSEEEPWLLEVKYSCGEEQGKKSPIVLVGKGVTFDTGGISIKPSANMGLMRGDMGGAACVAATTVAAAQLGLPVSLVSLMPLCENMPSGKAVKPGDVVRAMNGKTIEVDNTDAEGRLLLADALSYAHSFSPSAIVDLATLTGAIDVALGSGAAAVFSTSKLLWQQLHMAGQCTGDRVWRMPLFSQYSEQIESHLADVVNTGKRSRSAGACTAACFLKEFVTLPHWAHIDIAGVMESHGEVPYLGKGMTGRPTRTLIKFLEDHTLPETRLAM